jgi:class 3 adenylate cyclase
MPRLRAAFANKIVLIGTTLPEEERKTTSARFMPPHAPAGVANHPCDLPHLASTDPGTGAVPGVHVHAAAIEAVWHGFAAVPASPGTVRGLAVGGAILGLAFGLCLAPLPAAAAAACAAGALFALEIIAAVRSTWLPVAIPALAIVGATAYAFAVCAMLEGRMKRLIQAAFARYVSPLVVERIADDAAGPLVGGTSRTITVMFADLTGFTALSDRLSADALLLAVNGYLAVIADEVEAGGGYVDKFIGDAVMAIWNAPKADADHALSATCTALRVHEKITAHAASERQAGRPALELKIALHTGEAIVGNVGSTNRLNFTAVGRTVNVAARLERAGEPFGCPIVLSGATAELVQPSLKLRPLGDMQLRGIRETMALYTPDQGMQPV